MSTQAGELAALYRNTVLEHSRSPHNFGRMEDPDRQAEGHNPLCGDKLTVYLRMPGDRIEAIRFEGVGCAICTASASLMTDVVDGHSRAEAEDTTRHVLEILSDPDSDATALPGELPALAGVRSYPSRIKCATLAWKTLTKALLDEHDIATTE